MTIEELRRRRHDAAREARGILSAAEARSGTSGLTTEERGRFDALDAEIVDLDRRIRGAEITGGDEDGQRSGRGHEFGAMQPGAGGASEGRADFLLGERRFADWQASRGVRSDFEPGEARGFSLGRLVQRMAGRSIGDDDLEQRAQAAGADSTGGVLVPESLASFVLDRIRPQTQVLNAGAQIVPMDSDELSIPRIASGVVGGWRAENAAVAVADMAFERVKLTAKTLAVIVKLPMEMWEDVRPEGARAIENELTLALATELDRVALRGSGVAPEPRGVRNQAGVEVQSLGVNGAALTSFDPLVRAVGGVMRDSFTPNAAIYSPRTWETMALFKDTTGQPLQRPTLPDGFRELVSAQVPDNVPVGTNNDTSEITVGAWGNLLIGVRPSASASSRSIRRSRGTCRSASSRGCARTSRWRTPRRSPSSPGHADGRRKGEGPRARAPQRLRRRRAVPGRRRGDGARRGGRRAHRAALRREAGRAARRRRRARRGGRARGRGVRAAP